MAPSSALQATLDHAPVLGLHAKSMVVDDAIAVIRDARIAGDLAGAMDVDMLPENAWRTTAEFDPDATVGVRKRFAVWWRRVVPKAVL